MLSQHSIYKLDRETNIDEDFFLNKNALQRTIRITIDIKIKESTFSVMGNVKDIENKEISTPIIFYVIVFLIIKKILFIILKNNFNLIRNQI